MIIVNADDYGNDENRTLAIVEAFAKGYVNRTTAMTNCDWFEQAMAIAKNKGFIDRVGLHFNITEGQPITDEMRNENFFCNDGLFNGSFHNSACGRFILPSSAKLALAIEAEAQFKKFISCGGVLKHFDSHHHVHTDYSVSQVVFPIAKKYGFVSTRLSLEIGTNVGFLKKTYKALFNKYAKTEFPESKAVLATVKGFLSARREDVVKRSIEIMVHPVFSNNIVVDDGIPMCDLQFGL